MNVNHYARSRLIAWLSLLVFATGGRAGEEETRAATAHVESLTALDLRVERNAARMLVDGRRIFRHDTFGDEAFWGGTLKLHRAILGSALGGDGPGLSPTAALALGLKVDVDALPPTLITELRARRVDLDAPATTVALLRLNAVVGVTGLPNGSIPSTGSQ